MRPKHTRRDADHAEIRDGLRALGAEVWDTADLGGGVLDLVVFWRGQVVFVEVKAPGKEGRLTAKQQESMLQLLAVGVKAIVATSIEDVVAVFGT